MKLTKNALNKVIDQDVRLALCAELGVTDQTIMEYRRANKDNGPLTTYGAVKVIRELTDLNDDQILEEKSRSQRVKVKH